MKESTIMPKRKIRWLSSLLNDFPVTSKIKARFKLDDDAGKR